MRLFFILFLFILLNNNLLSQNKEVLKFISEQVNVSELKHATVSISVADCATNQLVIEYNSDLSIIPASTRKILTTAMAIQILGDRYQFSTLLKQDGEIDKDNGILHGNLYVIGMGDPTLGSKYFEDIPKTQFLKTWADTIKAMGINQIEGKIIMDNGLYENQNTPQTWTWEDIGNYYGASIHGINVYDNLYELYFQSFKHGQATKIIGQNPSIKGMTFENQVTGSNRRGDNAYIIGGPYSLHRLCTGTITKNQQKFTVKGSIANPAEILKQEMERTFEDYNILLDKKDLVATEKHLLFEHKSPNLLDIIKQTNYRSINSYAEALLLHLGFFERSSGDYTSSIQVVESFLDSIKIEHSGVNIYDGSGLSRYNTTTTGFQTQVLLYMKQKSKHWNVFYQSLPIGGVSGTLKHMFKNTGAVGKVHAKSGSVRKVRAYAGYIETKSGRFLAFSTNINHFEGTDRNARKILEQIILSIYENY